MADLFKGFIPSNGKAPLYSVKTFVPLLTPPESDYVGVLKEDYIQVDFDSVEHANKILEIVNAYKLKCDILKTTRGVHLYFLNDPCIKSQSTHVYNAIGIPCDIGLGIKNRVVPLRITKTEQLSEIEDGEEVYKSVTSTHTREWLQKVDSLEVIPCFLRPISLKDYDIPNTSTRNQTLFNYILTLQKCGFSKEEIRKTIKVINNFVLKEKLPDSEINTITRDDAFSQEMFYDADGKFLHNLFGNYMLLNSNILLIDGQPHIYTNKGVYSNDPLEFEKVMIEKIPSLKDSQRKEVYKFICLKVTKEGSFAPAKFIGLKNSILNIETMEQFPYSPEFVINNRIPFDFDEFAESPIMEKTLLKVCCGDSQLVSLMEEMIGYSLYRKNNMQTCFILTGEGSNGKSTILNCIKKLLGKNNYTSLDMRELEDTFKPSELYNKLANIGDDISGKFMEDTSVFKKCVTGESFIVQRKYGQPFELECYATQIFCANDIPNVRDRSEGFGRRLTIIPFNATFRKTDVDYDPFIEEKLLEDSSIEYLLKVGIFGLKRLLENRALTKAEISENERSEYIKSNNNVLEWFDTLPKIENESVSDVYMAYQIWCSSNGCSPVKKLNLSKEIKKQFGLISKPITLCGKSIRVFMN